MELVRAMVVCDCGVIAGNTRFPSTYGGYFIADISSLRGL